MVLKQFSRSKLPRGSKFEIKLPRNVIRYHQLDETFSSCGIDGGFHLLFN